MLRGMPKEEVTLIKRNGETSEIKALVQSELIIVDDATANIEEEDIFIRKLSNGNQEYYRVLDRGFYRRTGVLLTF